MRLKRQTNKQLKFSIKIFNITSAACFGLAMVFFIMFLFSIPHQVKLIVMCGTLTIVYMILGTSSLAIINSEQIKLEIRRKEWFIIK